MASSERDVGINGATFVKEPYRFLDQPHSKRSKWKIICVGAGASGLYLAYSCERRMKDYELTIYEKNSDIGGTWLENTYPGCACDVPSHIYTYSFRPNPSYSKYYAQSDEIQRYFKSFEREYNLDRYITFNTAVVKAEWKDDEGIYIVDVRQPDGTVTKDWCNTLINCSGVLNERKWPNITGLDKFKNKLHSASWDHTVNYTGKQVAIIGVGSSGIQITPQIQKAASSLKVFARSPVWVTPQLGGLQRAEDSPTPQNPFLTEILMRGSQPFDYSEEEIEAFSRDPKLLLSLRRAMEVSICGNIDMFRVGSEKQAIMFNAVTEAMRRECGDDEDLKANLIPKFPLGCRRITPGSGFLAALTSSNTKAIFTKIQEVNETGIRTVDGEHHEFDVIVCATGFQVGFCPFFPILGQGGANLQKQWSPDPNCYLGIAAPGFPNYFSPLGPRGPWGNGTVLTALELNLDYFITIMMKMQSEGIKSMMPTQKAVDDFAEHADAWHEGSVWNQDCMSWYKREGPKSKPYLWCGSTPSYMKTMSTIRYEDYEYKYKHGNRFAYVGNGMVAADYLSREEKMIKLVPYIRTAETSWEIE